MVLAQLKYKHRRWISGFSDEDALMHVFSLLQITSGSEDSGDDSTENVTLVGFIDGDDSF